MDRFYQHCIDMNLITSIAEIPQALFSFENFRFYLTNIVQLWSNYA